MCCDLVELLFFLLSLVIPIHPSYSKETFYIHISYSIFYSKLYILFNPYADTPIYPHYKMLYVLFIYIISYVIIIYICTIYYISQYIILFYNCITCPQIICIIYLNQFNLFSSVSSAEDSSRLCAAEKETEKRDGGEQRSVSESRD